MSDVFTWLFFVAITAATSFAFFKKIKRVEPHEKKLRFCFAVALWSFWLSLITLGSFFEMSADDPPHILAVLMWILVWLANFVLAALALLSALALKLSLKANREEKSSPHEY